jgi:hypothetical protein
MSIAIRQLGASPRSVFGAAVTGTRRTSLPVADSWLDALAKLIPGEMIIAFTAALHVPGVGNERLTHLTILVVFTALIPVVLWTSVRRAGVGAHWLQYAVRSTAFVLYGFGSDVVLMSWLDKLEWIPGVGALVVAVLAALVLSPPGAQRPPPEESAGGSSSTGPRSADDLSPRV